MTYIKWLAIISAIAAVGLLVAAVVTSVSSGTVAWLYFIYALVAGGLATVFAWGLSRSNRAAGKLDDNR